VSCPVCKSLRQQIVTCVEVGSSTVRLHASWMVRLTMIISEKVTRSPIVVLPRLSIHYTSFLWILWTFC
jgi:hypothetical protein